MHETRPFIGLLGVLASSALAGMLGCTRSPTPRATQPPAPEQITDTICPAIICTSRIAVAPSSSTTATTATITFSPDPPNPTTVGLCSGPTTISDTGGGGNTTVDLSGSGFTFYADAACNTPLGSSLSFSKSKPITFYWKATLAGGPVIWARGPQSCTTTTCGCPVCTYDPEGSQVQSVSPGPPSQIAFTSMARTVSSGQCSPGVTVSSEDQYGNASPVASAETLTLSSSSGTMQFFSDSSCATAATTTANIATGSSAVTFYFRDATAGSPSIQATSSSDGSATQTESVEASGAPTDLAITSAAQILPAGQCSAALTLESQTGGTATPVGSDTVISLSGSATTFYSDSSCATSTATATLASGSAQVTVYFIGTLAGTDTLTATASGLNPASQDEQIDPGPADGLIFTSTQQTVTTGTCSPNPASLGLIDAFGNSAVAGGAITVALSSTSASGTFYSDGACATGATSVSIPSGASGTTFTFEDTAAGNPTLTAAAAGLQSATQTETVTAGSASKLAFTVQPSSTTAGNAITPAVQVTVEDSLGNTVTSFSGSVTVALGTNPSGGTLGGTTTVSAVNGVAAFSNLSVDKAGTGYTLAASSGALTGATSSSFDVAAGSASKLAFTVQPSSTTAGSAISPTVEVTVEDASGNTVTGFSGSVTIALGNNPSGGTLGGTTTASAVNGVAAFSNLSLDKAGTGYTLTASSGALTGATSSSFDVTAGSASRLAFTVQPSSTTAGNAITPAVQVAVEDSLGNTVTSFSGSVTVALDNNPSGGTLGGTTTASAVNGVAAFSNLSVDKAGTGYTLTTSSGSLAGATSSPFDITAAGASQLIVTVSPLTLAIGTPADVGVEAVDPFGNVDTQYAGTVTFSSTDSAATLPAPLTFTSADQGMRTLSGALVFASAGIQSLTGSDGTISGTQAGITVTVPAPSILHDANLKAAVGAPYIYNSTGVATATGAGPITFSSCGGPAGFRVDASGAVRWTPSAAGSVNLCIQADNAYGTDQYTFTVGVVTRTATPVDAVFIVQPASGAAPLSTALDASGSSADPSALPLALRWDFGDGSPGAVGPTQSHTFALPGGYSVHLTAWDAYGASAAIAHLVEVDGPGGIRPPAAKLVASATQGQDSLTVAFSCDCTTGSSPIAAYQWDFGGGNRSTESAPSFTFGPGRWTVHLTVVDADGLTASDSAWIVVTQGSAVPPECRASAFPSSGPAPLTTTWSASVAPGSSAITGVAWALDGSDSTPGNSVSRTYAGPGRHEGVLTVTDAAGLTCEDRVEVTALAGSGTRAPEIVSAPSSSAECGRAYTYSASGAAAAAGDGPLKWSAVSPPRGFSIDPTTGAITWMPTRTEAGVQHVELTVQNASGSDTQAFDVQVSCAAAQHLKVTYGCNSATGGGGWAFLLLALLLPPWKRWRAGRDSNPRPSA